MVRSGFGLRIIWLLGAGFCLALPVFVPTYPYPAGILEDAMGAATGIMFLLSFPASLIGMPFIYMVDALLGTRPNTISESYINLFLLFTLGFAQWFWLVPRLLRWKKSGLQILDLHARKPSALGEAHISTDFPFFDSNSKTPVERVIDDYSEK